MQSESIFCQIIRIGVNLSYDSIVMATDFLIKPTVVHKAIVRLANRRSHNHLPGYLALLHKSRSANSTEMGLSDIEKFHSDFLSIKDAPKSKPYIQPFRSRGKGVMLLNKNLQGSYAPSSIRPGQPLSHVIRIVKGDRQGEAGDRFNYELVEDHANKVLSEMLVGNKILAVSLSMFLFRDRLLSLPSGKIQELIFALRAFLGINSDGHEGDLIYETLFEDDSSDYSDHDLEKR